MRRKLGTTLDAGLYARAKEAARRQGVNTNALIEEALRRFLTGRASGGSVVSETRGTYKVPSGALKSVLHEDLCGPE